MTSKQTGAQRARRFVTTPTHPHAFERGQEWGRFEFGSTVVLVIPPGVAKLDVKPAGTSLVLGSRIGSSTI